MKWRTKVSSPQTSARHRLVRGAAGAATILVLGGLLLFYLYYLQRSNDLERRNLRVVEMLVARVDASVTAHRQFIKNFAKPPEALRALTKLEQDLAVRKFQEKMIYERCIERQLSLLASGNFPQLAKYLEECVQQPTSQSPSRQHNSVNADNSSEAQTDEYKIEQLKARLQKDLKTRQEEMSFLVPTFSRFEVKSRAPILASDPRETFVRAGDRLEKFAQRVDYSGDHPSLELSFRSVPDAGIDTAPEKATETGGASTDKKRTEDIGSTGSVPITTFLGSALQSDPTGTFDSFFIASAAGKILVNKSQSAFRLTDLRQVRQKGVLRSSEAISLEVLLASTSVHRITIGDRTFRLFTQPYRVWTTWEQKPVSSSVTDAEAPDSPEEIWIVGGLVPEQEFVSEALAVPSSAFLATLAVILLGFLSWPLLRLTLIGAGERVRLLDVVLVTVSAVAGLSILTIAILDTTFYRGIAATSHRQLEGMNASIRTAIKEEIVEILTELRQKNMQLPKLVAVSGSEDNKVGDLLATQIPIDTYPFFESISLIDEQGNQIYKWSTESFATPRISVKSRDYFNEIHSNRGWRSGDDRYYVQSIRSLTTGDPQAVVSIAVDVKLFYELQRATATSASASTLANPSVFAFTFATLQPMLRNLERMLSNPPVLAMATELIPVIRPVLPPGFSFALIDHEGTVLFHRDPERNTVENFFDEADADDQLMAAVYARRDKRIRDLSYGGKEYRAHVSPIEGTPWTLIMMRDKSIERAMNVEIVLITLVFLLMYLSIWAAMALALILFWRQNRLAWLWPPRDPARSYFRPVLALAALGVAFMVSIALMRGQSLLLATFIFPFAGFLLTYSLLRWNEDLAFNSSIAGPSGERTPESLQPISPVAGNSLPSDEAKSSNETTERFPRVTLTILILVLSAIIFAVIAAPPKAAFDADPVLGKFLIIVPMALVLLILLIPADAFRKAALPLPQPVKRTILSWKAVVTIFLLVISVLPAAGFFKAAYKVELETLIKHGQVELARQLWERERRIAEDFDGSRGQNRPGKREGRLKISRDNVAYEKFFATKHEDNTVYRDPPTGADDPFPAFIESMLPFHASRGRTLELLHDRSSDEHRLWTRDDDSISLLTRMNPAHSLTGADSALQVKSKVPPNLRSLTTPMIRGLAFAGFALILLVAISLVWFVATRIFLVHLSRPLWAQAPLKAPFGENILLIRKDKPLEALVDPGDAVVVSIKALADRKSSDPWREQLINIDRARPGIDVFIADFDHQLGNEELDRRRLAFLQAILSRGRHVLVATRVAPNILLDSVTDKEGSPNEITWRGVLSRFLWLSEEKLSRGAHSCSGPFERSWLTELPDEVLAREAGIDPFLRQIAGELRGKLETPEQAIEEMLDRANAYYLDLWAVSGPQEKMALEHLATDGFLNGKARTAIRRLFARGLVRICPNHPAPHLMNESFRRFILSGDRKNEVLQIEQERPPSVWEAVRLPLSVGIAAMLIFFFVTQREIFDLTTSLITAATASLPAAIKLLGSFGARRAQAQ